jgi:hypothetical protein
MATAADILGEQSELPTIIAGLARHPFWTIIALIESRA